jgi:predicted MPP superfamily phosphohydrolase
MVLINSIVLLLLDIYIFKGVRATRMAFPKTALFSWIWWGYSIFLLVGIFISLYFNIPLAMRSIVLVAFFMTFVSKFIYAVILGLDDIRRGGVWIKRLLTSIISPTRKHAAESSTKKEFKGHKQLIDDVFAPGEPLPEAPVKGISRSEFLTRAGIVMAAAPLVPLSWGIISGAYDYRIRRQKLYLPNLPAAYHGLRLAQISDIHSGSFYNKTAVQGGVDLLLAENPDLIFVTGDIVNNVSSELREYQDIFAKLKAPLGVYSVLGNHDYGDYHYGREPSAAKAKNLVDLIEAQRIMGWKLLRNENEIIRVDNEVLAIVGVENWGTGRFPKHGDLKAALNGTDESAVKLLLSHDPSHWRAEIIPQSNVDVTFSGHTHGMQFGVRTEHIKWSPAQYIYKEWAGLYKQDEQQLYVNTGFGFLGYPGRVGILPEITIFELVRAEAPRKSTGKVV